MPAEAGELTCPRCGAAHAPQERLCRSCRMPLVADAGSEQQPLGEAHERARKINPRYARGQLSRVAVGRNLAEAELISGVLLEQGIPSMLRRTGGFDVPDFLAAGPRDVLVPEGGVDAARELLREVDDADADAGAAAGEAGPGQDPDALPAARPWELRLAAGLLAAVLAFGALAGIIVVLLK